MPQSSLNVKKSKKRTQRSSKSRGPKKQSKAVQQMQFESETQTLMYRPMGGTMLKRTLVYAERFISLDPGVGGLAASYVFRANDLRDPDSSGTGGQPRGFDQIMTMFDHYVVLGSKITVHFANTDTTQSQLVGIHAQDSATLTDYVGYVENGNTVSELIMPAGSGNSKCKLSYSINPSKFLGRANPLSDPNLKGSTSSSVSETCFFVIFAQPQAGTDSSQVRATVVLEYFTAFIEAKDPGAS